MKTSRNIAAMVLLIVFAEANISDGRAATPYEAQIAGAMTAILQTKITGEFAGRGPSQVDAALNRPVCKPNDYDDLRAVTDRRAFDDFYRRCRLVESTVDDTMVYSTAYLPSGHCSTLQAVLEKTLVEHVYASSTQDVIFEYKGSRFKNTVRDLVRGAQLNVDCLLDGALRMSAPRRRHAR